MEKLEEKPFTQEWTVNVPYGAMYVVKHGGDVTVSLGVFDGPIKPISLIFSESEAADLVSGFVGLGRGLRDFDDFESFMGKAQDTYTSKYGPDWHRREAPASVLARRGVTLEVKVLLPEL